MKRLLLGLICALLGAVFLFSGYAKLIPIEPFEYRLVDIGLANWQIAPFLARIVIGFEFLIGILLLFNLSLSKLTYKISIALLSIFCIYLILLLAFAGDTSNCGCFGAYLEITPFQALMKNIIMVGALIILHKYYEGFNLLRKLRAGCIAISLAILSLPFILYPIEMNYAEAYLAKPEYDYKLELDTLYNNAQLSTPPKTLSEGKHVISFMSLTCTHCRIAAKKLRIMHDRNPQISIYFVLNGKEKQLAGFFEETKAEDIPHCMLLGQNFVYLAGTNLPVICLVNNSIVENHVNYFDLDQGEIEKWLKK